MNSLLLLALLLAQLTLAAGQGRAPGETLSAEALLELYEQQLLDGPPAADVTAVEAELERLRAAGLPHLRLSQRSSWGFDELLDLGIGASLGWSLLDREAEVQRDLTAKRLELARHNARAQRTAQLLELRRSLRLLAHLDEVEALLARHRQQLLALRPGWLELERVGEMAAAEFVVAGGSGPATGDGYPRGPAIDAGAVAYLEVVNALERTRRERTLHLQSIAERVGVEPSRLANVDRPPLPSFEVLCSSSGGGGIGSSRGIGGGGHGDGQGIGSSGAIVSDEVSRARLLREEAVLTRELEAARATPQVRLELSGNANYSNTGLGGEPWSADLRLALRVALPGAAGVSSDLAVAVAPAGVSQELSVAWPPRHSPDPDTTAEAREAYERAVQRARLGALRNLAALQDARDRLALRAAELAGIRRGGGAPAASAGERLTARAQAELALLNAELEVDLALLELMANCGAVGSV